MKKLLTFFAACLLLAGCAAPKDTPGAAPSTAVPPSSAGEADAPPALFGPSGRAPLPLVSPSVAAAADAVVSELLTDGQTPDQEVLAAYLYLIEHVYFTEPVGLDLWRYRDGPGPAIPYLENRALSPLFFGVGSCEDFAAALTVLLRRMGHPAEYVSGLTISVDGDFVDHAWTVVRLDGAWYHLDPQLEQNVSKGGEVRFRYFLKDDRTMLADHRWGENLAAYWGAALTEEQRGALLTGMTPPACPQIRSPAPAPRRVALPPPPDKNALDSAIRSEKSAWEQRHGPLSPLELDLTPPIYALMPDPPR